MDRPAGGVQLMSAPRSFWSRLLGNPAAFAGFIICLLITIAAFAAPILSTHSPTDQVIRDRFQPPSAQHVLGTDHFGRDVFSRVLYGFRSSISIAFAAVGIAALFGTSLGLLAAYNGGWTDRIIMRLMDILLAFPIILLAIGILAVLGPGGFDVALAIRIVYLRSYDRTARRPSLTILSWGDVAAGSALGVPAHRILLHHALPHVAAPVLVELA